MINLGEYYHSSIGKKQIVAVTGLMLILFVVGHLLGNLLLLVGPDAFNAYAEKLAHLRPGLLVVEFGLGGIFLVHIFTTYLLVLENINARPEKYAVNQAKGSRSWATRLMPYTGTILFAFVIWHLMDFTFTDKHGPRSVLSDGISYGLYGVVYNAFLNPLHSLFYIVAMGALGFHLWHGLESLVQTLGLNDPKISSCLKKTSVIFGWLIALGFSAIPLFVLIKG